MARSILKLFQEQASIWNISRWIERAFFFFQKLSHTKMVDFQPKLVWPCVKSLINYKQSGFRTKSHPYPVKSYFCVEMCLSREILFVGWEVNLLSKISLEIQVAYTLSQEAS